MEAWISDTEAGQGLGGFERRRDAVAVESSRIVLRKMSPRPADGTHQTRPGPGDREERQHSQNIPTCVACNRPLPTKRSKGEKVAPTRAADRPRRRNNTARRTTPSTSCAAASCRRLDGADPAPCVLPPPRPAPDDGGGAATAASGPRPGAPDDRRDRERGGGGRVACASLCPPSRFEGPLAPPRRGWWGRAVRRSAIAATARIAATRRSGPRVGCIGGRQASSGARWYDATRRQGAYVRVSSAGRRLQSAPASWRLRLASFDIRCGGARVTRRPRDCGSAARRVAAHLVERLGAAGAGAAAFRGGLADGLCGNQNFTARSC